MPDRSQPATGLPYATVVLRHRINTLHLQVEFALTQPWTILFGPSGSGKTSILRAVAGLLHPASGHITLGRGDAAATLLDTASGVRLPPHLRRTPLVPQAPALFPHLTVRQNLDFGRPSRMAAPALFNTAPLQSRLPAQLSGGEAQRVSLARAVRSERPRLLLLDEPFAGLDLPLRDSVIADLRQLQRETGTPILSVTHDIAEAFSIGAEVIRLDEGRVVAQGPAAEVLATERQRLLDQLGGARTG